MKKNILSKILTLGVIAVPILIGTSLLSFSNITSNKSNLTITSKTIPTVPEDGIITKDFVKNLIRFKESQVPPGTWNGVLVESDFVGATSVENNGFFFMTEIKSVTLPITVKKIGEAAFNSLYYLTNISALGATSIGEHAFTNSNNISDLGIKLTESINVNLNESLNWGIASTNMLDIAPPIFPTMPENGTITNEFIINLIYYKKNTITNWDGSLLESDFEGATSVADNAFQNNTEIKSITLPSSVLTIGANAFSGASNLTTISALGATSIGANAFAGTNGITGIENSKINLTYSTDIKIGNVLFWGTASEKVSIANGLVEPTVPLIITNSFVNSLIEYKKYNSPTATPWNGVLVESDFVGATSIAESAFQIITEVTSIILPLTVLTIGDNAFAGASNLTTISALGATSIGANAFAETNKMSNGGIKLTGSENINVDQANNWGTTAEKLDIENAPKVPEDGIITSSFISELITYKKTTIANWDASLIENDFTNAISVADAAFQNNTEIKSITLPSSVLTIGANAFNGASALTTISALGATSIGSNAFVGTDKMSNGGIKLTGSENINVDQANNWGTTAGQLDIKNSPKVPEDGIITFGFISELITYKKEIATVANPWDGILVESDFANATSVADGAFQNNTEIKSITLPTSVLKIGLDAFNGASALTTISALGATSIGANAFVGMINMSIGGIKLTESENINVDQAGRWGIELDKLNIKPEDITTPPSDDQNMIYIIIGASVGVLLLIAGIITGVLIHRKKGNESLFISKKDKKSKDDSNKKSIDDDNTDESTVEVKDEETD